jgi:hypothetical protein
MSVRANTTNIGGQETVSGGNVATAGTFITTFPRPSGLTITVTRLNGAMTAAGAAVGDLVERDSDGGFWDTTVGIVVPPDYTSLQTGNDMVNQ